MARSYSTTVVEGMPETPLLGSNTINLIVTCFVILLCACLALYKQSPPAVVSASAPLADFSSGRALQHLEAITKRPHPIGTIEHGAVRDYILHTLRAAGLEPEIQRTTVADTQMMGLVHAGLVQNIAVRVKGTANTKAVLLVGHYDSMPNSLGASDDGAAVAAMLETLRALQTTPPLKNDVIFLFSDGEEAWMLGGKAFVEQHPWAKDVGLVLNFEARGSGGPSIMFETSERNGWLIREFAKAAPHPVAHSLAFEIYRILPNDTDLSIFKEAGYSGLNFAYINGLPRYHTLLDSFDHIDERSLQHHGTYALALTQHFGNLNLNETKENNAVYFDILGATMVHYPQALVLPLAALASLLFVGLVAFGLRRKRLTLKGLFSGFLAFLVAIVVGPGLAMLFWVVNVWLQGRGVARPEGETYNGDFYLIGFAALTIAVTAALYILLRKKISLPDLMAGGLLWWVLLMLGTSVMLPGASYLFVWPLLFSLIGLGFLLVSKDHFSAPLKPRLVIILTLCAVPGLLMLVPTIYQSFNGLTLSLIAPVLMLLVLLLGLLIPHLQVLSAQRRWLMPGAMALVSIGFIVAGGLRSGYSAEQPKLNDVFYGLHADTGKAIWGSSVLDEWTKQFHGQDAKRAPIPEFLTATYGRPWRTEAAALPLVAPEIQLLDDSTSDGVRTLRLRVTSPRQASVATVYVDSPFEVAGGTINHQRIDGSASTSTPDGRNQWRLRFYAMPPEGIELSLEIKSTQPVTLRVVDMSYGLPTIEGTAYQPRPSHMIPSPLSITDTTMVSKSFTF